VSQEKSSISFLFRSSDWVRSKLTSTGIGLTVTQRLIHAMNGRIKVFSVEGQGTSVTVTLPLTENPLSAAALELPDEIAFDRTTTAEMSARNIVLYIEDNLSNLRLVQRILSHRSTVSLISATCGEQGLALAREQRPELILLDIHLPDIEGPEVLSRLQEEPVTRRIPVVVISADATPRQIDRLLAQGARAYLTKPLDVKKFLDSIDEVLDNSVRK
jgi:CheY-like chemotaxis protein